MTTKLTIEPVTRIEGHARVILDVDDGGAVTGGRLQVLELRGFEKLLENMELLKMPMVTGRICGVCPAAHCLASAIAIEQGADAEIPQRARDLRELLYMGHILHSHALSCFALAGPDLLAGIDAPPGSKNIFSLLSSSPEAAKKMLRLRSIGQRIVEIIGGRGVHPVTVIPGGIAAEPPAEELRKIAEWGIESLALIEEFYPLMTGALAKIGPIREAARTENLPAALGRNGTVSFLDGACTVAGADGTAGQSFTAADYAARLIEHVMPGSYMKSVRLRGNPEKSFYVGPLARLNVNTTFATPKAAGLITSFKGNGARDSAVDTIEARLIEMVYCAEKITGLASADRTGGALSVPVETPEGRYTAMVEAPRGILIHDYTADGNGRVRAVNLIVATQNNYDAINGAITGVARRLKQENDRERLMSGVEFAIRCFDPCLACATHAMGKMPLAIEIRRAGKIVETLSREGR